MLRPIVFGEELVVLWTFMRKPANLFFDNGDNYLTRSRVLCFPAIRTSVLLLFDDCASSGRRCSSGRVPGVDE